MPIMVTIMTMLARSVLQATSLRTDLCLALPVHRGSHRRSEVQLVQLVLLESLTYTTVVMTVPSVSTVQQLVCQAVLSALVECLRVLTQAHPQVTATAVRQEHF